MQTTVLMDMDTGLVSPRTSLIFNLKSDLSLYMIVGLNHPLFLFLNLN